MRVLLLCHAFPPESVGGVEQHVAGLAGALCALGHRVTVWTRTDAPGTAQGAIASVAESAGVGAGPRVVRAAYRWEGVADLAGTYRSEPMAAALAAFLRERAAAGERFDVAHVHHLIGLSTGATAELRAAGIPVVLTLHDYWTMCPRGQMWHPRGEVCERVEPERCGECFAITFPHWFAPGAASAAAAARLHAEARELLALPQALVVPSARAIPPFAALGVPAERFRVVENGVDTDALASLPPPPCGPGPLRVGYLGTVIPSKGLHVIVSAVQSLPPGTAELHVHGNVVPYHGDSGYPLRCFQGLRPGDPVRYHGPYSSADLPRILAGLDVVAAPALWQESFGLTVREALAASRPVLVSRIGGLQDAVADGVEGRVLPPGDVAAWGKALAAFAADRAALRAMAKAARPRARGFRAMAEDLLAVYAAATGTTAPGAPAVTAAAPAAEAPRRA